MRDADYTGHPARITLRKAIDKICRILQDIQDLSCLS